MLSTAKAVVLAGTSPFAYQHRDLVPAIHKKIPIIGLNHFPERIYNPVDYWFLLDSFNPEFYKYINKQKIVTQAFTCIGDYPYYFKYVNSESFQFEKNGFLGGALNAAIFALNFAYVEGFRNVYLFGVDFAGWRDEAYCRACREYVEEINTVEGFSIKTLNPDSSINIEHINMEVLL